jgi:hypothetical protein
MRKIPKIYQLIALLILVLGIAIIASKLAAHKADANSWKEYKSGNILFSAPLGWVVNTCGGDKPFANIPGTISGKYKNSESYQLSIVGATTGKCTPSNQYGMTVVPEKEVQTNDECVAKNTGEQLSNGLFLELHQPEGSDTYTWVALVKQNHCYATQGQTMVEFSFDDPEEAIDTSKILKYGEPSVRTAELKNSQQYRDIKKFAESIQYK